MDHCPLQKFPSGRPPIFTLSKNLRSRNTRLHKPLTVPWYPPGPDLRCLMPAPPDQVYRFLAQNPRTATNTSIPPDFPSQIDGITSHVSLGTVMCSIFRPFQVAQLDFQFFVEMP